MPKYSPTDIIGTYNKWDDIVEWLEDQADIHTGHRVHHYHDVILGTRTQPQVQFTIYRTGGTTDEAVFNLSDLIEATPERTEARLAEEARVQAEQDADAEARRLANKESSERNMLRTLLERYPDEVPSLREV